MDNEFGILLIAILIAIWFELGNNGVTTVNADNLGCAQFAHQNDSSAPIKCLKTIIIGYHKVSLNTNSNTCSFYYQLEDSKYPSEPLISAGLSLVCVDKDNWECSSANISDTVEKAKMVNGHLSIGMSYNFGIDHNEIAPSDGFIGSISHWYRLALFYLNNQH